MFLCSQVVAAQVVSDEGGLCFTKAGEEDVLRVRLLNPDLTGQSLGEAFDAILAGDASYSPDDVPADVRAMTFQDLEGRELQSPVPPSYKCLNFHMHRAYAHAIKEGWLEEGAEGFEDYGSEGEYGLRSYLQASALAANIDAI